MEYVVRVVDEAGERIHALSMKPGVKLDVEVKTVHLEERPSRLVLTVMYTHSKPKGD